MTARRILLGVVALAVVVVAAGVWILRGPGPMDFSGGTKVALADYKAADPAGVPASVSNASLVERGAYLARAAVRPDLELPRVVRSRIVKRRGHLQALCEQGAPNAETLIELLAADGLYRLTPRTGRTHQLRVHMASLEIPIFGDPLYPNVIPDADQDPSDFSAPLRLLAQRIEFDDPLTGLRREFTSARPGP